jgi:polyferredoxin
MKRQQIRSLLIFVSFLAFPITIYYFSPVLIIEAAAKGIIAGSFLMFAMMLVGSLFFGRSFCGWLCPGAGLQEACFSIQNRRATGGKGNWIKYAIWVPWMGAIGYAAHFAGGLHKIDPLYQTVNGISVSDPFGYIIYFGFVGGIVVIALAAGRRAFCHYVCWMAPFLVIGTKLSDVCRLPALRLQAQPKRCISCRQCTQQCPMSLEVQNMVERNAMRDTECILCGTCADVCPKKAISYTLRAGNYNIDVKKAGVC